MVERIVVWLVKKLLVLAPDFHLHRNPGPRKKKEAHNGNEQPSERAIKENKLPNMEGEK